MDRVPRQMFWHVIHTLCVFLCLLVSDEIAMSTSSLALPQKQVRENVEWSLRYSDIVFRGKVRFIVESVFPMRELFPSLPAMQGDLPPFAAEIVSVGMIETVKGAHPGEDVSIIFPRDLSISSRCKPGDEILAAADYNVVLKKFVITNSDGLFVRNKDSWANQSQNAADPVRYEAREIEEVLKTADLPLLVAGEHVALSGDIVEVAVQDVRNSQEVARVSTLQVAVRDVFRGSGVPNRITVVCKEIYAPRRSAPVPSTTKGERWYFLLRKTGSLYEPVDGPNSLLRYERGVLLYNGRVASKYSPESFATAVSVSR